MAQTGALYALCLLDSLESAVSLQLGNSPGKTSLSFKFIEKCPHLIC